MGDEILSIIWNAFLESPHWVKAVLVLGVIVRVIWPNMMTETQSSPRRGRRRRYRPNHYW